MIEDRYTHNNGDLAYLSPIDLNIATNVTFNHKNNNKSETIDLFDPYQIKWFNQQSEENLIDYFEDVIEHYKIQEDFLYSASNLIEKEKELSNGLNYPIYQTDNYDEFNEWFEYGYANKYPEAVYTELKRVIKLYDSKIKQENFEERVND